MLIVSIKSLFLFFIFCKQIRQGRLQGVGQCLIREYRMVCHILRGNVSRDFFEVICLLEEFFQPLVSSFVDDFNASPSDVGL